MIFFTIDILLITSFPMVILKNLIKKRFGCDVLLSLKHSRKYFFLKKTHAECFVDKCFFRYLVGTTSYFKPLFVGNKTYINTCVHIYSRYMRCIIKLLECDADLQIKNNEGMTAVSRFLMFRNLFLNIYGKISLDKQECKQVTRNMFRHKIFHIHFKI